MKLVLATAALLGVLVASSALSAQSVDTARTMSNVKGFSLGASYVGASISTDRGSTTVSESGSGFHVEAAYGLGKRYSLGLEYASVNIDATASDLDKYTLSHIGLVGRLFLRKDIQRARPYLEASLLRREIAMDFSDGVDAATVEANSMGIGLGGGVQIFATPKLAVDFSGQYAFGSFSDWSVNGESVPGDELAAKSFLLRVGIRYYFH